MKNWMLHPQGAKESSFAPFPRFLLGSRERGFSNNRQQRRKTKIHLTLSRLLKNYSKSATGLVREDETWGTRQARNAVSMRELENRNAGAY